MGYIITVPDGYNGHTAKFHSIPLSVDGNLLKLQCAEPDMGYLIRWVHVEDYIKALDAVMEA